ncbi:MAG TPA: hypothetical protein PKD79_01915 [Candidatus Doudnabacteria bacterium]|nr:hypothetical protein [Candidatus Doudnabacteria bacterium]
MEGYLTGYMTAESLALLQQGELVDVHTKGGENMFEVEIDMSTVKMTARDVGPQAQLQVQLYDHIWM